MLLVTTHPTNVSTQLIPSAQLTYITADTPTASTAEALAQVVVTVLQDPPRVRLSPSSGLPWDLDPRLLHMVRHGGALSVHVKLCRAIKASLYEREWEGWQEPWRSWLAGGDPVGTAITLQFPQNQQDQAIQVCRILGASIPDAVEKRSYVTTVHPLNRRRRSGAPQPAGDHPSGEDQSGLARREQGPQGGATGGLQESPLPRPPGPSRPLAASRPRRSSRRPKFPQVSNSTRVGAPRQAAGQGPRGSGRLKLRRHPRRPGASPGGSEGS